MILMIDYNIYIHLANGIFIVITFINEIYNI